jgi:hypothetical protein
MEKTHWKKMINPDYIGAYLLQPNEDLRVRITKVVREMVKGTGGKEEECTVAHLQGQKPFILNHTNQKTISKVLGSPYIEDWSGKDILVFATTTKVAGETVECLRVRPTAPKTEPTKPAEPLSASIIEQVSNCTTLTELGEIWKANAELQSNGNFKKLITDKKGELNNVQK